MNQVYLIHFERPYKHVQHYLGYSKDLDARLEHHRSGDGARLMQVVNLAGIAWQVVRTWPGARQAERQLKNQKHAARFCPICNPDRWQNHGKL